MNAIDRIRTATAVLNRRRSRRHDPIALQIGLNAGQALTGVTRLRSRKGERWFYAANGPVTNSGALLHDIGKSRSLRTSRKSSLVTKNASTAAAPRGGLRATRFHSARASLP